MEMGWGWGGGGDKGGVIGRSSRISATCFQTNSCGNRESGHGLLIQISSTAASSFLALSRSSGVKGQRFV